MINKNIIKFNGILHTIKQVVYNIVSTKHEEI